jgi:hypothetical protein
MTLRDVQINLSGPHASVIVDGKDVTKGVKDLTFTWAPGGPAHLRLDVELYDVTTLSSVTTELLIDEATAQLLETAGWTRP